LDILKDSSTIAEEQELTVKRLVHDKTPLGNKNANGDRRVVLL
jgi:hypothetical protein